MTALQTILSRARRQGASDVHLVQGEPPIWRVAGQLQRQSEPPLDRVRLGELLETSTTAEQRDQLRVQRGLCVSREHPDFGRVRLTVSMRSDCPEMAIRLTEMTVRSAAELGLPPIVADLARRESGLVLVTGPTGVGKSTSLNFLVDQINQNDARKIITIEDPIEYVHRSARGLVIQQEVGADVLSFRSAAVQVLRQDPDVIVIGEMRDLETIETALLAAETGHLVLATLHTPDVLQTVQRIFSVFPADQQNAIVMQLANCLQAVIAQRLVPRADGVGQVLACEVCVATAAVRNVIRERQVHLLPNEMQTGARFQMQTLDASLISLCQQGEITLDAALAVAHNPDQVRRQAGPAIRR